MTLWKLMLSKPTSIANFVSKTWDLFDRSLYDILVYQRHYTLDLLNKICMLASKRSVSSYNPSLKLHCTTSQPYHDSTKYHRLISQLFYLTKNILDIYFADQQLSQFVSNPTVTHYQDALRILKYLKHNPAQGMFYSASTDLILFGFEDIDYASSSTTCFIINFPIFLGKSLIS